MTELQPLTAAETVASRRRATGVIASLVLVIVITAVAVKGIDRLTAPKPKPLPKPVAVSLYGQPADGLSYKGQNYVAAKDLEKTYELESASLPDGQLNLVNTQTAPLLLTSHDPAGTWLGEEKTRVEKWSKVRMDPTTGLPQTVYPWGTYFYPITIAHFGLEHYSLWIANKDEESRKTAIMVGNWFVSHQDASGGWPVPFDHVFRKGVTAPMKAGWYSAMSQGMAADLLSKLYVMTKDLRYRAAALKGLRVLSVPVAKGGVQRYFEDKYEWWEEYPTRDHPTFVLNGFIYCLIGVYDTAKLLHDDQSMKLYERGLRSLTRMVNLYDLGSRSSYDLLHYSIPGTPPNIARWGYHNTHLMLLSAMNVIANGRFTTIEKRWLGYENGIPAPHN